MVLSDPEGEKLEKLGVETFDSAYHKPPSIGFHRLFCERLFLI